jgi:hypothetical protein
MLIFITGMTSLPDSLARSSLGMTQEAVFKTNRKIFPQVGLHVRLFSYYCKLVNERKTSFLFVGTLYFIALIIK